MSVMADVRCAECGDAVPIVSQEETYGWTLDVRVAPHTCEDQD